MGDQYFCARVYPIRLWPPVEPCYRNRYNFYCTVSVYRQLLLVSLIIYWFFAARPYLITTAKYHAAELAFRYAEQEGPPTKLPIVKLNWFQFGISGANVWKGQAVVACGYVTTAQCRLKLPDSFLLYINKNPPPPSIHVPRLQKLLTL